MDTNSTSKKADSFLQTNNHELQAIFAKVRQLEELQRHVVPFLDAAIQPYCRVANLLGSTLILLVANGAVATQVRFQAIDIVRKFKQNPFLQGINAIQCKVRPMETTTRQAPIDHNKKIALLSAETAEIMREIADSIDDPKIKAALKKLAAHEKK